MCVADVGASSRYALPRRTRLFGQADGGGHKGFQNICAFLFINLQLFDNLDSWISLLLIRSRRHFHGDIKA